MVKSIVYAAVAALGFAGSANAEDGGPELSATLAIVSDYIVRGVSQTGGDPAAQGSVGVEYQGFGASVWASNVSFADAEVDFIGFYTWDTIGSSFVVGAIYYAYPGSPPDVDYWEGFASWSRDAGSATIAASVYATPDYSFDSGVAVYAQSSLTIGIAKRLSFIAQGGRQWIEDNAAAGLPDYWRWSAGLAYEFDPLTFSVSYEDTGVPSGLCAHNICGPQIVGGISVSF